MIWNKTSAKLLVLRLMYVITILLVQTDVLTADEFMPHFDKGLHFTMQTESAGDEIEPDDDYTRTRMVVCPSAAIVPLILTLIPNIYILPQEEVVKPKPEIACVTCNNSRQATLCTYLI